MYNGETSQADIEHHTQGWIKTYQKIFNSWINIALKLVTNKSPTVTHFM